MIRVLAVLLYVTLRSDIARVYAPGKEPGLISGTTASNAAGSGLPEAGGKEKGTVSNGNTAHDFKDDRTR